MLLLFGRFKQPARLGLGIVLVIIGIVIHEPILALVGAAFAVWGLYMVVDVLRSRGRSTRRNTGQDGGGDGGER
jgi:hypothetical protein